MGTISTKYSSADELAEEGWHVVDFRTHGTYHGPDTLLGCLKYIAEDVGFPCSVDEVWASDKEGLPYTVHSGDGNTGLAIQPHGRWIDP